MKKAYIVKNYNSGWVIQTRVESLTDWARDGQVPFEIDDNGIDAMFILDDTKKATYESDYKWDQDVALFNSMIKDMSDPLFTEEGQSITTIDLTTAKPEELESFNNLALESCSSLGYDMLKPYGFKFPEMKETTSEANGVDRVAQLEAMAKSVDLTAGMEGIEDLEPSEPIEEYSRENDPMLPTANIEEEELGPAVIEDEQLSDAGIPIPPDVPTVEPEDKQEAVAAVSVPEEDQDTTATTEVIKPTENNNTRIVDPRHEFIDEFMEVCKSYDITPKGLVAVIMSIKALANSAAKVSDTTIKETVPEDVTGNEEYKYQDAIPYPPDPHQGREIPVQGMNIADGGMNNVDFAAELIKRQKLMGKESMETVEGGYYEFPMKVAPTPATADDIYSSLTNDEVGTEGLFSRQPSDNEVLRDIKKICEDVKQLAKKAWQELQERNEDLIAKYGAFIKILLDIKDIIFMDRRTISLDIAAFNIKKANQEVIPDSLEEGIMKQISKTSITAAFGPFAAMAKDSDKPGQLLLSLANDLRTKVESAVPDKVSKKVKPMLLLEEDELNGSYTLKLKFDNVPQVEETSTESVEEPIETPVVEEPKSFLEKLALESLNDDDFFNKVLEHKSEIDYAEAMDCVNNNMWSYYKTGEKTKLDRSISSKRILEYIKK